jgi:tetratricopeptide (TPR) repeat protein
MYSPGIDRSGTQRLLALASYAEKLQPNDPDTAAVLGYVYENQGDLEAAARMAGLRLSANYSDYAAGVRYLQLGWSALDRPDEKRAFLESIASKEQLPSPLRAEAAYMLADMLFRAGRKEQAIQAYSQVLQLDPYHAEAAQARVTAAGKPPPVDAAKTLAILFRASPRNVSAASNLALTLNYLGLHKQAMHFFELVWELRSESKDKPNVELTSQYFNIMLDAGEYAKAIRTFESLPDDVAKDRQVMSLMVEAHRSSGQAEKADELAQRVLSEYGGKDPNSLLPQVAGELATFLIDTETMPQGILPYARRAAAMNPDSPMTQRLLGVAEVKSGQAESVSAGLERLEKLRTADVFVGAVLAEAHFAAGREDAGKETLLGAAAATQSGLAYRRLSALAKRKGIELPLLPGADEARQAIEQLGQEGLQMGARPEGFVSVSLKAAKSSFAPGEPIEIEATLTNKGKAELPLGNWGLFRPTMNLHVSAAPLTKERFVGIPLVVWPAPRCLPAGADVRRTIRLDSGSLADFLARRPLEELKLTVTGLVDPVQKGLFKEESSVPAVCPQPLTVTRASLLPVSESQAPEAWAEAYQYALRLIVTDLSRGDLQRRMQAGRQIASLMAGVREVECGRAKLPIQLHGVVNKPVLLAMLKKALEDRSAAVRAETLAALIAAKLDEPILAIVAPVEKDPSPLVRFRLAELLGVSRASGQRAVMERLALDGDPLVKMMAGTFQQPRGGKVGGS